MNHLFEKNKQILMITALTMSLLGCGAMSSAEVTSATILTFHDINYTEGQKVGYSDGMPDNFRDMMEFLDRNYHVVPLDQIVQWRLGKATLPENPIAVTFDDNYIGDYWFAAPILAELNQTGTMFVHSKYPGIVTAKDHPDWDELNEVFQKGVMAIESHTVTHPVNLTEVDNIKEEVEKSRTDIRANMPGNECKYFAYPCGSSNDYVIECLQNAGYKAAVIGSQETTRPDSSIYLLGRKTIVNDMDLEDFKKKIEFTDHDKNGPIIVDNDEPGYTSTGIWNQYGSTFNHHGAYDATSQQVASSETETATARFTPFLRDGLHDVYTWYGFQSDASSEVTYRISHSDIITTQTVDQRFDNGHWNHLGRYQFNEGTEGFVEITNVGTTGTVCADAIKFQPVTEETPLPREPILITTPLGQMSDTIKWNIAIPQTGYYEVNLIYTNGLPLHDILEAPFSVVSTRGDHKVTLAPLGTTNNKITTVLLGVYPFKEGKQTVVKLNSPLGKKHPKIIPTVKLRWVAKD